MKEITSLKRLVLAAAVFHAAIGTHAFAGWPPPPYPGSVKAWECAGEECAARGFKMEPRDDGLFVSGREAVAYVAKEPNTRKVVNHLVRAYKSIPWDRERARRTVADLKPGKASVPEVLLDGVTAQVTFYERDKDGKLTGYRASAHPNAEGFGLDLMPDANMVTIYEKDALTADRPAVLPPEKLPFPVYPGSSYAPEDSVSACGERASTFYTSDAPENVLAFYRKPEFRERTTFSPDLFIFERPEDDKISVTVETADREKTGITKIIMSCPEK